MFSSVQQNEPWIRNIEMSKLILLWNAMMRLYMLLFCLLLLFSFSLFLFLFLFLSFYLSVSLCVSHVIRSAFISLRSTGQTASDTQFMCLDSICVYIPNCCYLAIYCYCYYCESINVLLLTLSMINIQLIVCSSV